MRKLTKWIVCLFAIALVLSCTGVVAFAAENDALSLSGPGSVKAGHSVTVSVNAEAADLVTDGVLVVTYDPELLSYVGAAAGSAWSETADLSLRDSCKAAEGTVTLAFAAVDAAAEGDIIRLEFTALKEGTAKVAIDADRSRLTGAAGWNLAAELELTVLPSVCTGGEDCPSARFTDLNLNEWYHEGIDYALTAGYMNGMSETTFGPLVSTNRAMMVTVLYRMVGQPEVGDVENPFTDVTESDYFYDAVLWAYSNDITTGMSKTTFAPHSALTREQLVTFLFRYAVYQEYDVGIVNPLSSYGFTDTDEISPWALKAISWAVDKGLVNGMTETTLVPKGTANRAMIAKLTMMMDQTFES